MQQQREQWEPDRKALDAKIENTISNANCNAGNTKRIPATVNDGHHQPNDELACALHWCRNDGNDYVVDDDINELAAGNTTNPIENGASIRASQRNFMRNKEQRKFPIDNNTDDTHKLFAKSNDRAAEAAAAAAADNSNNNDANRYECSALSPMVMPPTMIQCESVIYLETYYNHIVRMKRIELMSFENFMFLFIFTSFLFSFVFFFFVSDVNAFDVHLMRNGSVGDTITIFPTCIVSAEQFYARLGEHYHSFNNFHVKLNAECEANKLKRYSLIPGMRGS